MRHIIIGTGAVGGVIGGLLASAGKDVVLVARGRQLAALRTGGLEVTTATGTVRVHPPTAAGPQDVELRPDDVLVLAVKSQDTTAALTAWADRPVAGGGTAAERLPVVCAQNGVDNERAALRQFATVVAMCVWLPATFLEPGRVSAGGTPVPGVLTVGPAAQGVDPDLVTAYARDLVDAGLRAPATADVMAWKYRKLLSNLANAVEALCGTTRDEAAAELAGRADAEGRAVLAAAGIDVLDEAVHDAARAGFTMSRLPGLEHTGGSSWQSLVRGTGSIEADHLNGEIVLLGRLHGVPTPVNAVLQRRARQAAATGAEPGSFTAGALLRESVG
ncbi:2-dehydropantoate 2-reductase [Cellulomonas sp. Root485]|uniref:ketopantoate reductase family protein n=1 Tax=Cellulomonas sp. Root485 TaxID=1736546 RepID=UPI000700C7CA|nr:2-dehydropantoate 2-reductase N-terminal domain-containing protein [Cellulomonas sp. Root485]KQY24726.1 2-dehydropantoate 2-reductase [Cellulomonas sp. Root485]